MKTKLEAIKKAYGVHFEDYKHLINENGGITIYWDVAFYNISKHPDNDLVVRLVHDKVECYVNENGYIIPKALIGIETNNGWTRIESEEDLPKENGTYYVMTKDGMKSLYWMNGMGKRYNVKKWMEYKPTHYLLEVVPNPPIY